MIKNEVLITLELHFLCFCTVYPRTQRYESRRGEEYCAVEQAVGSSRVAREPDEEFHNDRRNEELTGIEQAEEDGEARHIAPSPEVYRQAHKGRITEAHREAEDKAAEHQHCRGGDEGHCKHHRRRYRS